MASPVPTRPNILVLYATGASVVEDQDVHVLGNNDMWRLLEASRYQVDRLILRHDRMDAIKAMDLARYDLVINAISDADLNPGGLALATDFCASLNRPVINAPAQVARTGRDAVASRLAGIDGLHVPKVTKMSADAIQGLSAPPAGMSWPLLIREAGSHGAMDLQRIDDAEALGPILAAWDQADSFYLSEFTDCRRETGEYWKCRVMVVDGEPLVRHALAADHWVVNTTHRNRLKQQRPDLFEREVDEMRRLHGFCTHGPGRAIIDKITDALRLDYYGIDLTQRADGSLVLFEANAAMNMLPLSDPPPPVYVRIVRRLSAMVQAMVDNRLASAAHSTAS